ncbi:hypothetical protein JRI60_21850 [Archangium violaceum]|uniref:M14 family metallopeptidase n=1 Tax=Archangium violaceum TaxID=83451 RepID=UPI00194F2B3F|nr:M14 family metallopeptidase [Archangium violaceum]QRO01472.1 hypothetical protein JRI60_21850 [Archangium violaceum]
MRLLGALAIAVLLVAGRAWGEGYPIPRGERPIAWKAVESVGEWRIEGDSLSLATPRASRNYFIQEDLALPAPFLRARVRNVARADLAILFRAKVRATQPLFSLTGYGFYVDGRRETVGFVRYDGARVDDSGVRARVRGLGKVGEIEIALFVAGPAFAAHVYDARSKKELASLTWSDPAFAEGTPGVYANRSQPPEVSVSLFVPEPPPQEASARDGLTTEWLVRLMRGTVLDAQVRAHLRRADREEDADVYVASEVGVELVRASVSSQVRDIRAGVPYRLRDPSFKTRLAKARNALPRDAFVEGIKDPELIGLALNALAAREPARARVIEVGRTHEDRPILGLVIGEAPEDRSRPAVLLCGGTHANEAVTPEVPLDAARWLLEHRGEPRVARWLRTYNVVVVPLVNPDGSHAFWHVSDSIGRTNRRRDEQAKELELLEYGVDLNRNYPFQWRNVEDRFNRDDVRSPFFRGPAPGSEPEVRAMMKLGEAWRFVGMVSYHAAATRLLVPYTVEGAREPVPSAAWVLAPELVASTQVSPAGKRYEAVRNLYPVGGTDQDWFYWSFGTLAYMVELPFTVPGARRPLEPMIEGVRPIWQVLMDRFLDGPSLTVRVPETFRAEGPVMVAIEEIQWPNGERFTTHPETGVFHTYLPAVGRYTVRVTSTSGKTMSRAVEVGTGRAMVTLEDGATPGP